MSTINDTDLFVVERNGTQYKLANADMSTINETDLFVVERGGSQYKVEAQYVNILTGTITTPVSVLTPFNGSGLSEGQSIEPISSAITAVGGSGTYVAPAKTHGTYTYNQANATLTVSGSTTFVAGESLVMTDQNGSVVNFTPQTTAITSVSGKTVSFASGNSALSLFSVGDTFTNSAAFSGSVVGTVGSNLTALLDGSGGFGYGPTNPTCGLPPRSWCPSNPTHSICVDWIQCSGTSGGSGNDVTVSLTFTATGITASTLKVPSWNVHGTKVITVTYFGGGSTVINNWSSSGSYSLDNTKDIESITFLGKMYGSDYASDPTMQFKILLDDEVIVTDSTTITIQSIDIANNTMTLDIAGFKVGQTISKSSTVSGTGTIGSVNGGVITLSADNQQWVDNYYMTKPQGAAQAYDNLLTFSDVTNLDQLVAPIEMTDSSGAVTSSTASSTNIIYISGSQVAVNNTTGTYVTGLHVEGAQVTGSAPSATDVVFTSFNDGTTAYSGTESSLASRTWTLESSNSASGPFSSVGTYVDTGVNSSQDGATPWSTAPTLSADTYYKVKVKYNSENAASQESAFNTFKTAA